MANKLKVNPTVWVGPSTLRWTLGTLEVQAACRGGSFLAIFLRKNLKDNKLRLEKSLVNRPDVLANIFKLNQGDVAFSFLKLHAANNAGLLVETEH